MHIRYKTASRSTIKNHETSKDWEKKMFFNKIQQPWTIRNETSTLNKRSRKWRYHQAPPALSDCSERERGFFFFFFFWSEERDRDTERQRDTEREFISGFSELFFYKWKRKDKNGGGLPGTRRIWSNSNFFIWKVASLTWVRWRFNRG